MNLLKARCIVMEFANCFIVTVKNEIDLRTRDLMASAKSFAVASKLPKPESALLGVFA